MYTEEWRDGKVYDPLEHIRQQRFQAVSRLDKVGRSVELEQSDGRYWELIVGRI